MNVKIGYNLGLNVDGDSLKFGKLMPGTSSERSILVNNNATYPLRVIILKSGYIADWVRVSENNFILKEKESKEVFFEAFAPLNEGYGEYKGKLKIIFKKILLNK